MFGLFAPATSCSGSLVSGPFYRLDWKYSVANRQQCMEGTKVANLPNTLA